MFQTTRVTLALAGGHYFSAMLSGEWHDGEDEFFIDRDSEPFAIILSFLRSGCQSLDFDVSNKNLFSRVLHEAEFYGVDCLLEKVKIACCRNMKDLSLPPTSTSEEALATFDSKFSNISALVHLEQFPACFVRAPEFHRVLSVEALASGALVELVGCNPGHSRFLTAVALVTYETSSTAGASLLNPWYTRTCRMTRIG